MPRPIRILELRSVRGTGGGPEKTILQGAARTDPARFEVSVCYIRDRRDAAFGVTARTTGTAIVYREIEERHSFDPSIWPALGRIIVDRRPDIIHAHDYKTNLLGWLLWRATGVLPLSTVHGWTGHSRRERFVYYPFDKQVLARYPRLVAVSSDIRNELVRHGARPERVTTILNGIDHRLFRREPAREAGARAALRIDADATVIGAVGRLEPQKRFDLLMDAVALLRPSRPDLRLVIVGDGSLRDALASHMAARNLADCCIFTGHTLDIAGVHHAFDLFVQSSDYEGTPNSNRRSSRPGRGAQRNWPWTACTASSSRPATRGSWPTPSPPRSRTRGPRAAGRGRPVCASSASCHSTHACSASKRSTKK